MLLQNRVVGAVRKSTCTWKDGCRYLLTYDRIPGYTRMPWIERKRIDHQAACALLFTSAFRRAVFWVGVMTVLMHVLAWHLDLQGAMRDMLRASPLLFSFPWVASARRRKILALLSIRDKAHRQARSDA